MGIMWTNYVAALDWGYIIIENFHDKLLFNAFLYTHKDKKDLEIILTIH